VLFFFSSLDYEHDNGYACNAGDHAEEDEDARWLVPKLISVVGSRII